jgi:hypothetical protein
MDTARFSERDGAPQRFAIECQLDAASLRLGIAVGRHKKLTDALFHLCWLYRMTQHPAPGTVMRHPLSLQMQELTQFTTAQFGPMSHATAALLACQFGEHSDHA